MSTSSDSVEKKISIGPLTVTLAPEKNQARLEIDGKNIVLSPKERELLDFLAARADQWVTKFAIYEGLWSAPRPDQVVINVFVCKLRSAISREINPPLPKGMHYLTSDGQGSYILSSELKPMFNKKHSKLPKSTGLIQKLHDRRNT